MYHLDAGLLAALAGFLASMVGLGGAILLVPALIVIGMAPSEAAPLGLVAVAAISIAAAPRQLRSHLVNHRLGVTMELVASSAAVVGALGSGLLSARFVAYMLATVALASAVVGSRGRGLRNPPVDACEMSDVGERVGTLAGAYPLGDAVVPYTPRRIGPSLAVVALSGFIAGTAGVSGGFVKTTAETELMGVPMKVASATTTFTVGITAAVALVVFAVQGRLDTREAATVLVGSLIGGRLGAAVQHRLSPTTIRYLRSALLVIVAIVLVARVR